MVLYIRTNHLYPNRLAYKKSLNLSSSQYEKMMELGILIPINKEDLNLKYDKKAV